VRNPVLLFLVVDDVSDLEGNTVAKLLIIALATASVVGLATGTWAAQISQQDEHFVADAAQTNIAEVDAGHMAVQKGTSPAVKQLGETLITDHTRAENQLRQIAQQQGLQLPSTPSQEQQAMANRLSQAKPGRAGFDTAFAKDMVEGHQKAISKFQQEAQTTNDPALRSYAQTTLPVLQKHLQMSEAASRGGETP
jgi:putative membrane protein